MKMKSVIYAGLGALALASTAFAQSSQVNQHNVNLNLTVTFEGPVQYKFQESSSNESYSYKSKFVVGKFSNKEFLEALVEDGLISEIKGWSVVLLVAQDGDVISLFITKKNTDPIDVSDYLAYELEEVVEEYDEKETYYANGDYEETDKWTERGLAYVGLDLPYLTAELSGSYTAKLEYSFFTDEGIETLAKAPPLGEFEKTTGGSIDDLVGEGSYETEDGEGEEDTEDVLIEGSIGISGPKLVNFGLFAN